MGTSPPVVRLPRCGVVVEEAGDELVLTRRTGWRPLGVALLALFVAYTYVFVVIPLGAMGFGPPLPPGLRPARGRARPVDPRELPPRLLLVAVPAAVGWPFLLAWTLGQLTGLERVRIGPAGVDYLRGRLPLRRRRTVPLNEVRGLAYGSGHYDERPLILTWGGSIPLIGAWAFDREGGERLAEIVAGRLMALKAGDRSTATPPSPPTLALEHAPGRVRFSTLYSTEAGYGVAGQVSGYGCLLVPTLWLNGVVALLLLEALSPFDWGRHGGLLLSAIPGLFLAFLCVWAANENFVRDTWTFDEEQVTEDHDLFGIPIGRKAHFPTRRLASVAIQPFLLEPRFDGKPRLVGLETAVAFPLGIDYRAEFRGTDGKELGIIGKMTAADALWLLRALRDGLKGTLDESETLLTLPRGAEDSPWDREFDD